MSKVSYEPVNKYYILVRDLTVSRPNIEVGRRKKLEPAERLSELLRGTILQEVIALTKSPTCLHLTCLVLDTEEIIECHDYDVTLISEAVMLLLLAVPSCKDRFEIFRNRERLADGLEMEVGREVVVRLPNVPGEVRGKLRFKGQIAHKMGSYFGIELYVRAGNCSGSVNKHKYFECGEDHAVFVSLNRVKSRQFEQQQQTTSASSAPPSTSGGRRSTALTSSPSRHAVTSSTRYPSSSSSPRNSTVTSSASSSRSNAAVATSSYSSNNSSSGAGLAEPVVGVSAPVVGVTSLELSGLGVHIGMKVYIFTEVEGRESQERGTVRFIGRLDELPSSEIYVGIDLERAAGNGRGVFKRRQLFQTELNHAALVPLSGVLPASTFDPAPSAQQEELDERLGLHRLELTSSTTSSSSRSNLRHNGMYHTAPHTKRKQHATTAKGGVVRQETGMTSSSSIFPRRDPPDGGTLHLAGEEVEHRPASTSSLVKAFGDSPRSERLHAARPRSLGLIQTDFEGSGFEVGSMVEVVGGIPSGDVTLVGSLCGVIKWIGYPEGSNRKELIAGVELDFPVMGLTDGVHDGIRYFACPTDRAAFVPLANCKHDPRFFPANEVMTSQLIDLSTPPPEHKNFGDFEAASIPGHVCPPTRLTPDMVGKRRGIQGHHNSCYLDATLFSLFAYSFCLDSVLFREKKGDDLPQYRKVQKILKEDIVNPLRERSFVRADRVLQLRELLDQLGSVTGLTHEEKDPEEFLQTLLREVMKAEPLFEVRQGDSLELQACYHHQIFFDRDEKMILPNTQLLLHQSFLVSDLKFKQTPVCLILQMPRFGKSYKMYNRVRPSLQLDVTDLIDEFPRSCSMCGQLATFECKQCSLQRSIQENIVSYCDNCACIVHRHPQRSNHNYKGVRVSEHFRKSAQGLKGDVAMERQVLELFAVVCIETSHYVSFAKCGLGAERAWCFFDSMADRVGERDGYNIPEVTRVHDFERWLAIDDGKVVDMDRREMPDHMRRLFCDAYLCMYQSRDMMCYG